MALFVNGIAIGCESSKINTSSLQSFIDDKRQPRIDRKAPRTSLRNLPTRRIKFRIVEITSRNPSVLSKKRVDLRFDADLIGWTFNDFGAQTANVQGCFGVRL